jgi:hypothetical protein
MSRMIQAFHPGLDAGADTAAERRHWPAPSGRVQGLVIALALAVIVALTFAN